jgi:hypothetical protein
VDRRKYQVGRAIRKQNLMLAVKTVHRSNEEQAVPKVVE